MALARDTIFVFFLKNKIIGHIKNLQVQQTLSGLGWNIKVMPSRSIMERRQLWFENTETSLSSNTELFAILEHVNQSDLTDN